MNNETLFCMGKWSVASPSTKLKKYLELERSSSTTLKIFGNSDDAIEETAVFLGTLGSLEATAAKTLIIHYNDAFKLDAARSEQLAPLFGPTKKITFRSCVVNKFLCNVLATRPHRIDLKFETSAIDLDVLMDRLEARTAPFGSLSLGDTDLERELQRRLCNHL